MHLLSEFISPLIIPRREIYIPEGPLFSYENADPNIFNEGDLNWLSYTWVEDGEFTITADLRLFFELIGGGGGAGTCATPTNRSGGGGAGGRLLLDIILSPGTYLVRIGLGGIGAEIGSAQRGLNGGNTQILLINEEPAFTAFGGGGGGGGEGSTLISTGASGGSGGGGASNRNGGPGIAGQGFSGGNGYHGNNHTELASGGGGGVLGVGESATLGVRGLGGPGMTSLFNGIAANICRGGDGNDINGFNATAPIGFGSGAHGQRTTTTMNGNAGRLVAKYTLA